MSQDCQGQTPLHYAARVGFYGVLNLFGFHTVINHEDNEGNTPLFCAVTALLEEEFCEVSTTEQLQALKEFYRVLAHPGMEHFSQLDGETLSGKLRLMINGLLQLGAKTANSEGQTVLALCQNWLKEHGTTDQFKQASLI